MRQGWYAHLPQISGAGQGQLQAGWLMLGRLSQEGGGGGALKKKRWWHCGGAAQLTHSTDTLN
eukprot:COSAG01_NODE_1446_length_10280_cov_51.403791_4_plen_63_part_00